MNENFWKTAPSRKETNLLLDQYYKSVWDSFPKEISRLAAIIPPPLREGNPKNEDGKFQHIQELRMKQRKEAEENYLLTPKERLLSEASFWHGSYIFNPLDQEPEDGDDPLPEWQNNLEKLLAEIIFYLRREDFQTVFEKFSMLNDVNLCGPLPEELDLKGPFWLDLQKALSSSGG